MIYFVLCSCMSIGEVALNAILIPNNCPDNSLCLQMFCHVGREKKPATDDRCVCSYLFLWTENQSLICDCEDDFLHLGA